jgi:hypothetical protein
MLRPVQPTFTTPAGLRVTRVADTIDEDTTGTPVDLRDTPQQAGESYQTRADAPLSLAVSLDAGATWHGSLAQPGVVGTPEQVLIRPVVAAYGTADNPVLTGEVWVDGAPGAAGWRV